MRVSTDLEWRLQDKIKVRGSKDLYVGSFYRPPNNTDAEYLGTLESYLARIPTHNGAHIWLGGDYPHLIYQCFIVGKKEV
jgi:hypothetical protein